MTDIKNAKEGDFLVYGDSFNRRLIKVERVTATQVVCERDIRFSKRYGKMIGHTGWSSTYAKIATDEDVKAIQTKTKIRQFKSWLERLEVTEKNLEAVERFYESLKELK